MNEPTLIDELLSSSHTIAVVGYSARPDRPSNSVSRTLRAHGYRVIPVNPQLRHAEIDGERSYDRLAFTAAGAGGLCALAGAAVLLWPASPVQPTVSPHDLSLRWTSRF